MKNIIKIGLAMSLLFSACTKQKETEEVEHKIENHSNIIEISKHQFDVMGIRLGSIESRNLRNIVKASGYLEVPPQNKAIVTTYIGATISKIFVLEGQFVQKGQALASLEHPDFINLQERYLVAKNNLTYLEKEYLRQKELSEQNAAAAKVFQKAESDFNKEKATLSASAQQLKLLNINPDDISNGNIVKSFSLKSPIEGYVGKISAFIGMFVEPAKPLFEIIDNRQIHCDLYVYEKDLFKVKIGQKVDFVLTNIAEHQQLHESKTIQGEIFGINKSFENESKALAVHAKIENESHELIEGMYVNASIIIDADSTTAVPSEAIVKSDGKEFIFVSEHSRASNLPIDNKDAKEPLNNYHFRMVEVVSGISDLGYTEIKLIDNIPDNSRIVIKGAFFVLSKIKSSEAGNEH